MTRDNIDNSVSRRKILKNTNEIIEKSVVWAYPLDECGAYDYTHKFAAATAEFHKNIDELTWGSVGSALIALVGASSISAGAAAVLVGGIAFVAGVAGIVTDTEALTIGSEEFDDSYFGWTQTQYSVDVAPGYHRSRDDLLHYGTAPTHPARLA